MDPEGSTCSGEHRRYHHGNLREALVAAGVELARADGPSAVVLRAASRQAGVSHNAAYRHFANQEDLLAAVAQRCMTRLSLLMIERRDRVTTRGRGRRAADQLEAIGRAYIDFARTEPGWFRTAFSSAARRPPDDGSAVGHTKREVAEIDSDARPHELMRAALEELVGAGAITAERRIGAEYAVWSAVHGLSSLLLDGPLRELSDQDVEHAMSTVLGAVCRSLA
jgi:AcrR family transcriptional regulator